MTAWPLNCAAAHAAEMVFWRRGGDARHGLLIDTPAVPLRFELDTAPAESVAAASDEPARARAPWYLVRDLKPR